MAKHNYDGPKMRAVLDVSQQTFRSLMSKTGPKLGLRTKTMTNAVEFFRKEEKERLERKAVADAAKAKRDAARKGKAPTRRGKKRGAPEPEEDEEEEAAKRQKIEDDEAAAAAAVAAAEEADAEGEVEEQQQQVEEQPRVKSTAGRDLQIILTSPRYFPNPPSWRMFPASVWILRKRTRCQCWRLAM